MIKRYILRIELHRRHLPRISFKRAPRPGDRLKDGGVWGTLRLCPECQEGFLHEPDPSRRTGPAPLPPGPHTWHGSYCLECEADVSWCPYPPPPPKRPLLGVIAAELAKNIQTGRSTRVRYERPYRRPSHVELKVDEPEPEVPVVALKIVEPTEHVELKLDEPEQHVELKIEDESPETLELDYKPEKKKYKLGDILLAHGAEYVVDSLTKKKAYLVRKDVWDARKKAEHVELKVDPPAEHVSLKFD